MQKLLLSITTFFFLVLQGINAQPSDLNSYLLKNSLGIEVSADEFSGPGMDLLTEEFSKNQFILFGERHFTREIPVFLESLLPSLLEAGFNHLGLEVGPIGATHLTNKVLLSEPQDHPYGVPFYVTKEEFGFVKTFLENSKSKNKVWGLDVEALFGVRTVISELKRKDLNAKEQELADDLHQASASAYEEFMSTGKYSRAPIFRKEIRSKLNELQSISSNEEVKWTINKLLSDAEIHLSRDGYFKNSRRTDLMKENFMKYFMDEFQETGEYPKVMVKLGSNHIFRHFNEQHLPDLGNYMANLAKSLGENSLHVALYQAKSTTIWWISENAQKGNLQPRDKPYEYSYPPVLVDIAPKTQWTLFDLRPLRELIWRQRWVEEEDKIEWLKNAPEGLIKIAESQDLVIIIPETTPQTLLRD